MPGTIAAIASPSFRWPALSRWMPSTGLDAIDRAGVEEGDAAIVGDPLHLLAELLRLLGPPSNMSPSQPIWTSGAGATSSTFGGALAGAFFAASTRSTSRPAPSAMS